MLIIAGAAVGLLAAVWVPAAWAGVFGGSFTAIVSVIVIGAQAEWQRRSEIRRHLPAVLEVSTARGRFPLVGELSDPIAVGVHPAAAIDTAGMINRIPPYITRDIEPELHAALRRGGFVLLVGESAAGKTRAAFEATRLLHGNCRFVSPTSREALRAVLEVLEETGDYVVWLDDLERFLGAGGLTTASLQRLLAPQVRTVVVATMRSHEYDRYRDRVETELPGTDRDVWREGRAVLRQAQVVHLDRRWTSQERSRAQAHVSDERLARALAVADRFGIAETLAAGPELAEAWRHGWAPGQHPRGAALVAAAVGARQAGYHRPLPLAVLDRMHSAYLAVRGGPELRPESMAEAIRWATTPTFANGANSLLLGSAEDGFLAFDYLIDLPQADRMPDPSWSALADAVGATDAYLLGEQALGAGRYDHALLAYRRAAETGYLPAEATLVNLGVLFRPPPESLERARQHLSRTRDEFGPDREETILAEQSIIMIGLRIGNYEDTLKQAERLVARSEVLLGPGHRLVLAAKFSIGYCKFKLGAIDEGLAKIDSTIEECAQALGILDTATIDRRIVAVGLLAEAGRTDVAQERLAALLMDCSDFPAGHFITMRLNEAAGRLNDNL
jgi:tetratricopeptide (TPR) repeat protein